MKPGLKSSEFWLTLVTIVFIGWLVTKGLDAKDAAEYMLVLSGAFLGQRWHLKTKNGNNYEEPLDPPPGPNPPAAPAAA